jgi:hypothetical protein
MFDSVDGNGDGVLSLPELHTFLVGPQVRGGRTCVGFKEKDIGFQV